MIDKERAALVKFANNIPSISIDMDYSDHVGPLASASKTYVFLPFPLLFLPLTCNLSNVLSFVLVSLLSTNQCVGRQVSHLLGFPQNVFVRHGVVKTLICRVEFAGCEFLRDRRGWCRNYKAASLKQEEDEDCWGAHSAVCVR